MSIDGLEKRIAALEDIEAIKQIKTRYCAVCDNGYNPDKITTLFAEDGIWEGGEFGKAQGHAAIRTLFEGLDKLISFCQHNVMNSIIKVDGTHAKADWYLWCPYTSRKHNDTRWIAGRYEDDYVNVDGEWKFKHLRAIIRLHAPSEKSRNND
jgi:SnoaL-like domain